MMSSMPVHRSILAVDIENSTGSLRTNLIRQELRQALCVLLGEAVRITGVREGQLDPPTDRGDGMLILIHPVDEVPKTRLLSLLVPTLAQLLKERARLLPPAERACRAMRLRVVVHAGEVHRDRNGPFGVELDLACRLLDAPQLRDCLGRTEEPLVLAVSDYFYWEIVRHGYDGIPPPDSFRPLLRVEVAGRAHDGWVQVPPEDDGWNVPVQREGS
jgi:hypothetical protein